MRRFLPGLILDCCLAFIRFLLSYLALLNTFGLALPRRAAIAAPCSANGPLLLRNLLSLRLKK